MKVREFLRHFSPSDMDKELLFSSDEELNRLKDKCQIAGLKENPNVLVLYGIGGEVIQWTK